MAVSLAKRRRRAIPQGWRPRWPQPSRGSYSRIVCLGRLRRPSPLCWTAGRIRQHRSRRRRFSRLGTTVSSRPRPSISHHHRLLHAPSPLVSSFHGAIEQGLMVSGSAIGVRGPGSERPRPVQFSSAPARAKRLAKRRFRMGPAQLVALLHPLRSRIPVQHHRCRTVACRHSGGGEEAMITDHGKQESSTYQPPRASECQLQPLLRWQMGTMWES